jgi:hypothetical protein
MIIVAGFLTITALFTYFNFVFRYAGVPGILALEFANATDGREILSLWQMKDMLHIGRILTWVDFIYVIFYVALIITVSNRQIRKEPSIFLNALLRASFFFAVLSGIFDVVENICLLYDMYHVGGPTYFAPRWIAMLKFALVGWTVLVWAVSFIKSRLTQ